MDYRRPARRSGWRPMQPSSCSPHRGARTSGEQPEPPRRLARHPDRLTTRGQHGQPYRRAQESHDQIGARVAGRPSARATVTGTKSGWMIGAKSTHQTPSAYSGVMRAAISTARRVLPAPPAPVRRVIQARKGRRHLLGLGLPQPRGTLDVSQKQRCRSRRQKPVHAKIAPVHLRRVDRSRSC
jgi:hypothetical protein